MADEIDRSGNRGAFRDFEFAGVAVRYRGGERVIELPAKRVQAGEKVLPVGPDGVGNCTVFEALAGGAEIVRERVAVNGVEVSELEEPGLGEMAQRSLEKGLASIFRGGGSRGWPAGVSPVWLLIVAGGYDKAAA